MVPGGWHGPYVSEEKAAVAAGREKTLFTVDVVQARWEAWKVWDRAVRAFGESGWPEILSVVDLGFGRAWQEIAAL